MDRTWLTNRVDRTESEHNGSVDDNTIITQVKIVYFLKNTVGLTMITPYSVELVYFLNGHRQLLIDHVSSTSRQLTWDS